MAGRSIVRSLLLGAGAVALVLLVGCGGFVGWVLADLPPWLQWVQRQPIDGALGPAATVEGARGPIHVWRGGAGDGPTVVLVHGFMDSGPGWGAVATILAPTHRVVVPSLPGHGRSAPQEPPLTLEEVTAGFDRVMDGVDGPVVLVGNSLGGLVTARWALAHPDRVRRLVLVNSASLRLEVDRRTLIPRTAEDLHRKNTYILGEDAPELGWPLAGALIEMQDRPQFHALYDDLMAREVWTEDVLPALTVPTTVIWGTPDGFFPLEPYGKDVVSRIPGAELVVLDGCAHAPQYSCPERLVEALEVAIAAP